MGQWPEGSLTLSSSTIQIGRQVLNWRAGEKKTLQLHLQRRRHPHHHHRHHPRQHHHHPSQRQELAQDQHRKAPIKEDCRERGHPVFKNQENVFESIFRPFLFRSSRLASCSPSS